MIYSFALRCAEALNLKWDDVSVREITVKYTHQSYESQSKACRMYHPRENGHFKEIDNDYRKSFIELRRCLQIREEINNE